MWPVAFPSSGLPSLSALHMNALQQALLPIPVRQRKSCVLKSKQQEPPQGSLVSQAQTAEVYNATAESSQCHNPVF